MTKRAIVFDLDGTLIDSLSDIAGSLNCVLTEMGLPAHPIEAYRTMVGDGAAELVRRALPAECREALHADVLARYKARYRTHLVVESRPYPGIEALLDALEERSIPKAVLTNKPHAAAVEIVERLLGRFRWADVLGQRDGVPPKPHPAGALAAARALGVAPEACWFLGDTGTDMRTAHNAGMIAVGCLWGFRGREELEANGARYVVGAPGDLLALIDG
jgi:phosphoglycolate phosphatase